MSIEWIDAFVIPTPSRHFSYVNNLWEFWSTIPSQVQAPFLTLGMNDGLPYIEQMQRRSDRQLVWDVRRNDSIDAILLLPMPVIQQLSFFEDHNLWNRRLVWNSYNESPTKIRRRARVVVGVHARLPLPDPRRN